jgi:dynactin complex subunit
MTGIGRHITFLIAIAFLSIPAFAQGSDGQSPILPAEGSTQESRPKSIEENLEKFRIERENKEFREMIRRGEDSLKAADELASRLESRGRFTEQDKKELNQLEKNLKRIRSDLGGTDDKLDEEERELLQSGDAIELTKKLRERTADLLEELKRTTRFTISAGAIETANAALRVLRFMRLVN